MSRRKGDMMRKRVLFSLLCLSLTLFLIFSATGTAAGSITVRVGIYENNPKIFTDNNGNASGFWPEIIKEIASKEGWQIQYVHGTWSECLQKLGNNEIDLMPDVAYTEAGYDYPRRPVGDETSIP